MPGKDIHAGQRAALCRFQMPADGCVRLVRGQSRGQSQTPRRARAGVNPKEITVTDIQTTDAPTFAPCPEWCRRTELHATGLDDGQDLDGRWVRSHEGGASGPVGAQVEWGGETFDDGTLQMSILIDTLHLNPGQARQVTAAPLEAADAVEAAQPCPRHCGGRPGFPGRPAGGRDPPQADPGRRHGGAAAALADVDAR